MFDLDDRRASEECATFFDAKQSISERKIEKQRENDSNFRTMAEESFQSATDFVDELSIFISFCGCIFICALIFG